MLRTVCRRVESPRHVDRLADAFNQVVDDIFTGRPAPGALEIPIDVQYAQTTQPVFVTPGRTQFPGNAAAFDAIAGKLKKASRRVIVAGGGVVAAGASAALKALAEKLDCPVLTSVDGRGSIPEDHPLCVGNYYNSAGMYQAIGDADVTLAIGTRFAVGVDGQFAKQTPPGELLQIDIDPAMIGRTHRAHVGVQADAKLAIEALLSRLDDVSGNDAQFNEKIWSSREGVRSAMRKRLGEDWPHVMDKLRDALPRDGVFVRDQTISAYNWGNQQFPIYEPRSTMNPTSGAIGPGLPLAIGAAIGSGKRTVVIHGDGGFMFHATEMATAAQYQVPLLICVFNDQGYGVLRWLQDTRFGRINETDIGKMDFTTMAKSMGVPGERVKSVKEFKAAVDRGMQVTGPYLIDVDMEHFKPMEISIMPKKRAS
jgi:acetolactate synthase-1/2/3 large subunit